MIKLDDNLLQELGLGILPAEEKKKMLAHIYETLEMRVGMELAKQMSDAQLSEFEEFINRNDEAGALRWLEANFPNYKDVVASEFDKLKSEIRQVAPQILVSAQQQAQQAVPQQYVQQPVAQSPPMPAAPPAPPQSQYAAVPYPQQPQAPYQQQYAPPQPQPSYTQPQPMPPQTPQPYVQQPPQPPYPPQPSQPNDDQQGRQSDYGLAGR